MERHFLSKNEVQKVLYIRCMQGYRHSYGEALTQTKGTDECIRGTVLPWKKKKERIYDVPCVYGACACDKSSYQQIFS